MNNLHLIVSEQFPEFVQSDYPVFIEFIKAYYKWLDSQNITEYTDLVDIDKTPENFVRYFRQQLDVNGLMSNAIPFDTKYIKNIKEVYTSKGSEQALIYLLRVINGAETTISYLNEQILRASDGRWNQEQFITIRSTFGTVPSEIRNFFITYEYSSQRVEVTRFDKIDDRTVRLYFKNTVNLAITSGLKVQLRDSSNNIVYIGSGIKSPSSIRIKNGGRDWTLGQVIIIPGSQRDTIARVSKVNDVGSIQKIDIIEYGFEHTEFQTLIISPYPVKPLGSVYGITSQIIGVNPPALHHTISIDDYLSGITDSVIGIASGQFTDSYFLQDYVVSDYSGSKVFDVETFAPQQEESTNVDLTIEQWLLSRASLSLEYSDKVTLNGKWFDDKGQLSNESIRLHDNFYYQQFSYVIDSTVEPNVYINLARSIHPAGTKMFTNYSLMTNINAEITADTVFPFITIDINDVADISENEYKHFTKALDSDFVDLSDLITSKHFTKFLNDASVVSDDIQAKDLTKGLVDTSVTSDNIQAKDLTKGLADTSTVSDSLNNEFTKTLNDIASTTDQHNIIAYKYFNDSIEAYSSELTSLSLIRFTEEDYFAEDYFAIEKMLEIGI